MSINILEFEKPIAEVAEKIEALLLAASDNLNCLCASGSECGGSSATKVPLRPLPIVSPSRASSV